MGPDQDYAHERADKAFKEIMELLKTYYDISEPFYFKKEYRLSKDAMKSCLRDLFWIESTGNF